MSTPRRTFGKLPWRTRISDAIHKRLRANGRSLEITKSGWLLIALTLLVGAVAINSGANLLHLVFGALVGVIVLSGVASERMLARAQVTRSLGGICFAGQSTPVEIRLENRHPHRPLLCVSVESQNDATGVTQAPCLSLHVPPQGTRTLATTLCAKARGPQRAPSLVVATRYPWGFFLKKRDIECPLELFVAPRPGHASRAPRARVAHQGPAHTRCGAGSPELGEHRVYRPGDDPRRIDYKTSARSSELLLREGQAPALDLATFALPSPHDPQREDKLQDICAASIDRQTQGLPFAYLQGEATALSASTSLTQPQRAFQILATYARETRGKEGPLPKEEAA